jgi:hypothetical protein
MHRNGYLFLLRLFVMSMGIFVGSCQQQSSLNTAQLAPQKAGTAALTLQDVIREGQQCSRTLLNPSPGRCSIWSYAYRTTCSQSRPECGEQPCLQAATCKVRSTPYSGSSGYAESDIGYAKRLSPEYDAFRAAWASAQDKLRFGILSCALNGRQLVPFGAEQINGQPAGPNHGDTCYAGGCDGVRASHSVTRAAGYEYTNYRHHKINRAWAKDYHQYWFDFSCTSSFTWSMPVYAANLSACGCASRGPFPSCEDRWKSCSAGNDIYEIPSNQSEMKLAIESDKLAVHSSGTEKGSTQSICATCDDTPFTKDSLTTKLTCLQQSAADLTTKSLGSPPILGKLNGLQQLAIEYDGAQAESDAFRTAFQAPNALCGKSLNTQALALPACVSTQALSMCTRLINDHVGRDLVAGLFASCAEAVRDLPNQIAKCPVSQDSQIRLFQFAQMLGQNLLDKMDDRVAAHLNEPFAIATTEALQDYFKALDRWQDVLAATVSPEARISALEAIFRDFGASVSFPYNSTSLLSQANHSLDITQQALDILFPDRNHALLQGDVLAAITGQLLLKIVESLDSLSAFHDFAAVLKLQGGQPIRKSTAEGFWNVLADIDNVAHSPQGAQIGGFGPVLEKLAGHPAVLQSLTSFAVMPSSTYATGDIVRQSQIPSLYVDLASVIATAQDKARRAANTGLLLPGNDNIVTNNLLKASRMQLADDFSRQVSGFQSELDRLEQDTDNAFQQQIGDSMGLAAQAALEGDVDLLQLQISDLANRRTAHSAALQNNEGETSAKVVSLLNEYNQNSHPIDSYFRIEDHQGSFSGANATFNPDLSAPKLIESFKLMGPFVVPAGGVFRVDTSGAWSPTCGLRDSNVGSRITAYSPVGPQGYTLIKSSNSMQATSAVYGEKLQTTIGWRSHAGVDLFGLGVEYYADSSSTSYSDFSTTNTASDSSSASFVGGFSYYKSPIVPAPLGSLVALQYFGAPANPDIGDRHDAFVINNTGTNIAVDQTSTFYLLLNDIACSEPDSSSQLSVHVSVLQSYADATDPAKQAGQQFVAIAANALNKIRKQRAGFIKRGEILPSERSSLEALAHWSTAQTTLGAEVLANSPALVHLYELLVAQEIENIERAVAITSLDRAIAEKMLTIASLKRQLAFQSGAESWRRVTIERSIRRISFAHANTRAREMLETFLSTIATPLELWCPDAVRTLSLRTDLDALLNLGVAWTPHDVAGPLRSILGDVTQKYNTCFAAANSPNQDTIVIIGIPHPDHLDEFKPADSQVSLEEAQLFWDAFARQKTFSLSLSPELIMGNNRYLKCYDSLPIIRYATMVFSVPHDPQLVSLNQAPITYGVIQSSVQNLAASKGLVRTEFTDPDMLRWSMPVIFTDDVPELFSFVENSFTASPKKLARYQIGTSLLGEQKINFVPAWTNVSWDFQSSDLVGAYLVFNVEASRKNSITWIPGCP